MLKILCAGCLITGALALFPTSAGALQEGGVIARLETKPVLTLGEPVFADLRVHNKSSEPVRIDFGRNFRGNIQLVVNGVAAPSPGLPPGGGISFPGEVELKPGQSYTRRLLLNEWYDFDEPRKYELRLVLSSSSIRLEATATVEIGSRDPARLAEICEELASVATASQAESALQAAKALSQVDDEACLPAMIRVLKEGFHGKEGAIAGLARVGTSAAIQAIVDTWDALRWDQRALAFQELEKHGKQDDLRAALAMAGKSDKVEVPGAGCQQ